MCSERGGGGVDVRIKGYAGWMRSIFLFFSTKFLVLAVGPSRGAVGLGVGLQCWVWWSVWWGGHGRCLSDASIEGMDRMVCSRGGCILTGSSLSVVFRLGRVPYLVLGLGSASVVLERDSEQV